MTVYSVVVPVYGYVAVDVAAKNAEEAKDLAVNWVSLEAKIETNSSQILSAYLEELGTAERIVEGNVVYVDYVEVEILEGEDEDEDEDEDEE